MFYLRFTTGLLVASALLFTAAAEQCANNIDLNISLFRSLASPIGFDDDVSKVNEETSSSARYRNIMKPLVVLDDTFIVEQPSVESFQQVHSLPSYFLQIACTTVLRQ